MKNVLIVGAGPSGLSMAIFLKEKGYNITVIEKNKSTSDYSKALAINPKTLEIFDEYGISQNFLNKGRINKGVSIWKGNKFVYENDFTSIKHRHPYMLVIPQKTTEEILLMEVQKRNVNVLFNHELNDVKKVGEKYLSKVNVTNFGEHDYVIGADGGKSKIREIIGAKFEGYSYEDEWELFDLEMKTSLSKENAHIKIFPGGGMMIANIKNDEWRLAGNMKNITEYLPQGTDVKKVIWESKFKIHHKVSNKLVKENIVLIGDACHMHSPIGARGMNLGIQDAFIASKFIYENRLHEYESYRMPYIKKTVKKVNALTINVCENNFKSNFIRNNFHRFSFLFPFVSPKIRSFVLGLDS